MANPNGNPGNKGGGRKSTRDQRLIEEVVSGCWERVRANMKGKRLTEEQKDMIALEVVKRTAPKDIKLRGDDLSPVLVKFLDDKPTTND